jgi:mercuric ion binding protein
MMRIGMLAAAIALSGTVAWAATQTVVLSVPDMTCSACPITVRAALTKVPGVSKVDVSFEEKEAVVVFDDSKTSVEALMRATEKAGYPSALKTAAPCCPGRS